MQAKWSTSELTSCVCGLYHVQANTHLLNRFGQGCATPTQTEAPFRQNGVLLNRQGVCVCGLNHVQVNRHLLNRFGQGCATPSRVW
jgi:hypothetical protein